ncbi:MAG: GNAT family N-acetyltransferase [Burkholderiales bacterium]|nr:GNAT family N-acetyltransferase [Burkholderiales bacterium]MDR4516675.1 GNAT family N-acetyltransferase [Nitrosomonas sp.]
MKWHCRWATKQDQGALLELFTSAFGQPMPTGLWQWKYAWQEKPGILAHVDDAIIAYYGGIPRTFSLNGHAVSATQICDVMVAPKMRGILTRRGPFMHTADTFLTEQAGPEKPYRFAFGFPSHRHAKLGEKSGWYKRSETFLEVSWATETYRPRFPFWIKTKSLTVEDKASVDVQWQRMLTSLPDYLIPQKDANFFEWRYLNHPNYIYSSYIVFRRLGNTILGMITVRDHGSDQGMELMDLLGPPHLLPTLFETALGIAKRADRKKLFSWMTASILARLPNPTTTNEICGIYVTPDYQQIIDQQHLSWWFMSGDTDFR